MSTGPLLPENCSDENGLSLSLLSLSFFESVAVSLESVFAEVDFVALSECACCAARCLPLAMARPFARGAAVARAAGASASPGEPGEAVVGGADVSPDGVTPA